MFVPKLHEQLSTCRVLTKKACLGRGSPPSVRPQYDTVMYVGNADRLTVVVVEEGGGTVMLTGSAWIYGSSLARLLRGVHAMRAGE